VGTLAKSFIEMTRELEDSYRKLADHNKILEQKVEERTKALNKTLEEAKESNKKLIESIGYAKMIQVSMLPNPDELRDYLPDSFLIWMPKDIVGGDFIFTDAFGDGFIVAVVDCTGHGVPGAFMTMVAFSAIQRIIRYESCYNPAEILKRMNFLVKTSLQQDTDYAVSDDGMDVAICFLSDLNKDSECVLTYAGARMPILYTYQDKITIIRGDKQSIGYRKSDPGFDFTNHEIQIKKGMRFYMYSDGFVDQLNEDESQRFGTKRLKELVDAAKDVSFEKQKDMFLTTFYDYKGEGERQDDVTVVGFGF
jgi:serine phosphatase RsbU (regulator of sigma subunit)